MAYETFKNESGGHRFQRVPHNEKNGKVQTSTITIAVLPEVEENEFQITEDDLEWTATNSSKKAGGQSVNTAYSCIVLMHKPTKITVRCQNERSQHQNKRVALKIMKAKLSSLHEQREHSDRAQQRKDQIGSGQRGDKRRTIRFKDGQVNDHITGKKWQLKKYLNGDW